jgi:hypothetical protein
MRFRGALISLLVAIALAMLPLAGVAGQTGPGERGVASQSTMEPFVGVVAVDPLAPAMDASTPMDDCCPPHGAAGDPCTSAVCCGLHCISATPLSESSFRLVAMPICLGPIVPDQVRASIVGSAPFRPPRA